MDARRSPLSRLLRVSAVPVVLVLALNPSPVRAMTRAAVVEGSAAARVVPGGGDDSALSHPLAVAQDLFPTASPMPTPGPSTTSPPPSAPGRPGDGAAPWSWTWPVRPTPVVVHGFVAPTSPYGPGHRGIDLSTRDGAAVRAVDAGVVTHAGTVAGRATISITHPSGVRSTYEPVRTLVRRGDHIVRGQVIGWVEDTAGHCGPDPCVHLGAVTDDGYVDPLLFLAARRVVLLPLDGS